MVIRLEISVPAAALLAMLAFGCDSGKSPDRGRNPSGGSASQPSTTALPISRWTAELRDPRAEVRIAAVRAIGSAGAEARAAVPALLKVIDEDDLRLEVIRSLGAIGPEAKLAIPALIEALREGDRDVRSGAAAALARMGPEAVPDLIAAIPARSYAGASAGRPESVIEELIRRRPDEFLVGSVIVILAVLGAAVWITQLKIRHRERLARFEAGTALPNPTNGRLVVDPTCDRDCV